MRQYRDLDLGMEKKVSGGQEAKVRRPGETLDWLTTRNVTTPSLPALRNKKQNFTSLY